MTIHLIKLSVGTDSIDDLADWQKRQVARRKDMGFGKHPFHVTRMMPARREEVLDGGSIYWVIKRAIQARQHIVDLAEVRGSDGIARCAIVLDPEIVPTAPAPRRVFQGWRYLKPDEAPKDLAARGSGGAELPAELRRTLMEIGVW